MTFQTLINKVRHSQSNIPQSHPPWSLALISHARREEGEGDRNIQLLVHPSNGCGPGLGQLEARSPVRCSTLVAGTWALGSSSMLFAFLHEIVGKFMEIPRSSLELHCETLPIACGLLGAVEIHHLWLLQLSRNSNRMCLKDIYCICLCILVMKRLNASLVDVAKFPHTDVLFFFPPAMY